MTDKAGKVPESFQIQIEEVDQSEEGGIIEVGAERTGYGSNDEESLVSRPSNRFSLALRIRLTNHYEQLKFLVGPRRFWLETPNGRKIEPSPSARKEPALTEGYLKGGTTTSGWLVFKVPQGQKDLTLVSDLRRPQMEIPVTLPGSTD